MDNNNTIAGWVLAGGIAALGFSIVSGKYFHADNPERPEEMGYVIEGVESSEGGDSGPAIETLLQTADVAAGEKVFSKCAACHTINSGGANGIGPNLYASMGKPHGHVAGFAYSDALKSIPGNWDWNSMNEWLTSPRKYAPGTKMTFAGLGKAEDRANLMAYMNTQGAGIPLPAAPAAEASVPGDEAAPAEGGDGKAPADGEMAPTGDAAAAAAGVPAAGAAATQ